jgi:hypothetical protein
MVNSLYRQGVGEKGETHSSPKVTVRQRPVAAGSYLKYSRNRSSGLPASFQPSQPQVSGMLGKKVFNGLRRRVRSRLPEQLELESAALRQSSGRGLQHASAARRVFGKIRSDGIP